MKDNTDKMKWYEAVLLVLLFVIMIPYLIVIAIKDRVAENKREKIAKQKFEKRLQDMAAKTSLLLAFSVPVVPVSDEVFISRIDEFTCIQYRAFNGLSGWSCQYQLISSEFPQLKERVLSFLKDHPIENLLYGDIDCDGCDMNHWEIRFIFEDRNLNRRIRGYGFTEVSSPYLIHLVSLIRAGDQQAMRDEELRLERERIEQARRAADELEEIRKKLEND